MLSKIFCLSSSMNLGPDLSARGISALPLHSVKGYTTNPTRSNRILVILKTWRRRKKSSGRFIQFVIKSSGPDFTPVKHAASRYMHTVVLLDRGGSFWQWFRDDGTIAHTNRICRGFPVEINSRNRAQGGVYVQSRSPDPPLLSLKRLHIIAA